MPLNEEQRTKVKAIFEKFVQNRIERVRGLQINDFNINPFLFRILVSQMGFDDARSIVQWLVSQRLERGSVTSFGSALQEVAKVFSEGTGVEGADVLKTIAGTHYHIQVKSGR